MNMSVPVLSLALWLMVTGWASADLIEPPWYIKTAVKNATYDEIIMSTGGPVRKTGQDYEAPEFIYDHWTTPGTSPLTGTDNKGQAVSDSFGPTADVSGLAWGMIYGDGGSSGAFSDITVIAANSFDVAVYPKGEWVPPLPYVPLVFTGDYHLSLIGDLYGIRPAYASVWISVDDPFSGRLHSWDDTVSRRTPGAFSEERSGMYAFTVWAPIKGHSAGAYGLIRVNQSASVRLNSYAEVAHVATTNWSSGEAVIDPVIRVDPTWEHADDFALYFSPNMQPIPEPSTFVLLGMGGLGLLAFARHRRSC